METMDRGEKTKHSERMRVGELGSEKKREKTANGR